MKILCLNNYDMNFTLNEWRQDGQSAHQLWGITEMEKFGMEPSILPFSKSNFWKQLSNRIKIFGDLDQELRALEICGDYDLIYSGHYITNSLLAFLRKFGILKKPLVAISFQAPHKNLLGKIYVYFFVSGNDKIICLSETIKRHFEKDFGIPSEHLEVIDWGYDTSFHKARSSNLLSDPSQKSYILSTGKTFRDYRTLLKAFSEFNYPLEIIGYSNNILDSLEYTPENVNITIPLNAFQDPSSSQELRFKRFPQNIKIVENLLTTSEILEKYDNACAVAIPIELPRDSYNTVGLTSLVEAMCMGKAVITTENKEMGFDPEKEGIGFSVPYQDVSSWRQAVQYLFDNPEETQEMGRRARFLAESRYNLANFSKKTFRCMQALIDKKPSTLIEDLSTSDLLEDGLSSSAD